MRYILKPSGNSIREESEGASDLEANIFTFKGNGKGD